MSPSQIKRLCPRCQRRKDQGKWHLPISCQDCRLLNAQAAKPLPLDWYADPRADE